MSSSRFVPIAAMAAAVLAVSVPVKAQPWEIEAHAGGLIVSSTHGDGRVPEAGPTVLLPLGGHTRAIPSWYLADGASLLNNYFGPTAPLHLVPIDAVLKSPALERGTGVALGVRVSRRLSSRLSAEVSADYNSARLSLAPSVRSGAEASRSAFHSTWSTLFSEIGHASSTATIEDSGGRQWLATGALNIYLVREAKVRPFVTVGAGLLSNSHETAIVRLAGSYDFKLGTRTFDGPPASFREDDTLTLTSSVAKTGFVGVLGFGVKGRLSARWGWRAEVRDHFGTDEARNRIDAVPEVAQSTPESAFVFLGNPSLSFSNNDWLRSSLSGSPIHGFETFTASGMQHHVAITLGLTLKL